MIVSVIVSASISVNMNANVLLSGRHSGGNRYA
ncbi:hypothetical protein SHDE107825_00180 [Shewanella denitrificans]|jgi:hypothetical protein